MRYDIIGCGEVFRQYHAHVLQHLTEEGSLSIRACYDTDYGRAAAAARLLGAEAAAVWSPEADVLGTDAAFVATPPASHHAIARRYLSAGKHVLLEKPFVVDPREGRELVALAAENGARLFVGHMRRLYRGVRVARDWVESGGLGTIVRAEASEGGRWDWPAATDYVVTSPYGGVLFDTGSHVIDTLLFVLGCDCGEPDLVIHSSSRTPSAEPSHDFRASFTLWAGGAAVPVRFRVTRQDTLARAIKIVGTKGAMVLSGGFSLRPAIITNGRVFHADTAILAERPTTLDGCFLLEHKAVISAHEGSRERSVLDADRFLAVNKVLAELAAHE